MQHIIIYIVIAIAVAYAIKLTFKTLRYPTDICKGCKGCDIRNELLKNYDRKKGKPTCYNKK